MREVIRLLARPVERVWGGRRLEELLDRRLPPGPVGESWEVYGELEVSHGRFEGATLDQLVAAHGEALVGSHCRGTTTFPILTKWLDCRDWLSVQVHPDDRLAPVLSGQQDARGKSEAWYFRHVDPGAEVIHGVSPLARPNRLQVAEGEDWLDLVERRPVREGSFLYTPAGTVHALGPGLMLYEIQQSSELTYRLYDWGRDRPIHPDLARRCLLEAAASDDYRDRGQVVGSVRGGCSYFVVESLQGSSQWRVDPGSFEILALTDGRASLDGAELALGESVVLPASYGEVTLECDGPTHILRIRVP
ncbi:MAG: type I phosphomannose isomerase catalytic subunit [Vulcanimicrobiota bacterium]